MISTVLSVELPSMIIYSMLEYVWFKTESIVSFMVPELLKQTVIMLISFSFIISYLNPKFIAKRSNKVFTKVK